MDEQLPEISPFAIDCLWDEEGVLGAKIKRRPPPRLDREEVARNVVEVFNLVGGVPRLAHWANEHYDRFVTKVLPRIMPSTSATAVQIGNQMNITYVAAIPPGPLDVEVKDVQSDGTYT
jgi:hypothetical protein